jgi:AraC family transcriptional regulator, alkane utilization regulator
LDALSYLLQTVQLHTAVYSTIWLRPPWGVRIPSTPAAAFHAIVFGRCSLRTADTGPPVALGPGDVVVYPHGHAHTFFDHPDSPVHTIDPVTPTGLRPGTTQPPTDTFTPDPSATGVVCGHLWFDDPTANPLVDMLPPLLHFQAAADGRPTGWLEPILQVVALENDTPAPGQHALLTRLSDVIVIQAIRAHLTHLPPSAQGWLRALRDPQLGEALGLIHQHPDAPWTVARLASRVGLSRSTFAARFTHIVGEAPLQYLTRWRMHHAQRLLRAGNASTAQVAVQVGYQTEPAFSRAFKRHVGIPPSVFRRNTQNPPPAPIPHP